MQVHQHVPLAPLTTFQVGGPARYFVEARGESDVCAAVAEARSREWPLFVLGGGSNLVISDAGWPGLVLKIALTGIAERRDGACMLFDAAAGEDWDRFVAHTVARDCAGIECLSGIPGTVGGTPVQNVGAYGQDVSETITSVRVLDTAAGEIRDLENRDSGFAYRTSIFNTRERGRYIVLRVSFALMPGGSPHIEYADLKRHFAGRSTPPTLAETREAVRAIRLGKAMLIVPGDDDCRSAGSFFKNPVRGAGGAGTIAISRRAGSQLSGQGRHGARSRRLGWSSTPASPKACRVGRWASRASTRWPSSIAGAQPPPTSSL